MSYNCEPSICIPRAVNNITQETIKNIFENIFGDDCIDRIDIINENSYTSKFCKIFVHFKYWSNEDDIHVIRQRLIHGDNIKIVYNAPYFWKCSASRTPKPERTNTNNIDVIRDNRNKIFIDRITNTRESLETIG
tara:strand:- start:645 stop:1049 length:405 start_codon:yes stop_codon:yes gene_type:complete